MPPNSCEIRVILQDSNKFQSMSNEFQSMHNFTGFKWNSINRWECYRKCILRVVKKLVYFFEGKKIVY